MIPLRLALPFPRTLLLALLLSAAIPATPLCAQDSSSSSSSSTPSDRAADNAQTARAHLAQVEEGGAAVTLESSEALFQLAAALNVCGYDADLDPSEPGRPALRGERQQALLASEPARVSRDALCQYVSEHHLNDPGRDLGQYVSLALYLLPPPELTPSAALPDLPPDGVAVVNVLPLVRTFAEDVHLHAIWLAHRPEYEALLAQVHQPMERMITGSNIYLHQPVSSYDGRRFLVLLEPMIAPTVTHARIYANDYVVVMSPTPAEKDAVRMDQIRHIYLHYVVEPMVYSKAAATERLLPLLRPVQEAPLEFQYKSDIVALLVECLIKGIEARTYNMPEPAPQRPKGVRDRSETEQYEAAVAAYNRVNELERQKLVGLDERQGWVLTDYFFDKLQAMEHEGDGLRDEIGPMIYGMDVAREQHHDEQIVFAKTGSTDVLRGSPRQPRTLNDLDRAEMALMKGDRGTAEDLAKKTMADPKGDHGRARYVLSRISLMDGEPQEAFDGFTETLALSKDPRTLAWSHIYLGRLYDSARPPEREKALAEYKAGLAMRDAKPDTRLAAEKGIKAPFAIPQRAGAPKPVKDEDLDPTGKAEKEAYRPSTPK